MLHQETQDALSKLGLDVSKLVEAIQSEDEITLEVPEQKKFTDEEMTTFGKNRFNEGKQAVSEILAKKYKEEHSIDIEGKDLDKVVEAIKAKGFEEAKPDESVMNAKKDKEELQRKITELEEIRANEKAQYEQNVFQVGNKQRLLSLVPKEVNGNSADLVDLYLMKNQVANIEGNTVVQVDGQIVKDNLLNPVPVDEHFKSWIDSTGFVKKQGMGGEDSKSGSSASKFKNTAEFYAYAKDKGIEPLSEEGQKILMENKAADFAY